VRHVRVLPRGARWGPVGISLAVVGFRVVSARVMAPRS
jgi:hypothetical protein